ncbi:MAG TPA: thioesterase family protein [Anaeromyxobacteraceae bacterium]|nr:thioesterase family protein [Anaeromyxobacteraceae bacterium]
MATREPPRRSDYRWFSAVPTRWMDNDVYGHVNNAHYYSYFDTAINRLLIERGGLDIQGGTVVGYIVSSSCEYYAPVSYPDELVVGVRADRLGRRSAHYGVGLFRGGDDLASAAGTMVHVFVDRTTGKAVELPALVRQALAAISLVP